MNHRFFYKNENYRIYDSFEDTSFSSSSSSLSSEKNNINFLKQNGRENSLPQVIYHSNEIFNPPKRDYKGEYVTCQDIALNSSLKSIITERLNNSFEFRSNEAALIFHNAKVYNKSTKEAYGIQFSLILLRLFVIMKVTFFLLDK